MAAVPAVVSTPCVPPTPIEAAPEIALADAIQAIRDAGSIDSVERACTVLGGLSEQAPTEQLVEALLQAARYFIYKLKPMAGLSPSLDAARSARALGHDALLRKALTFRGLLLMDTANLPDATLCFSESLEIAQRTGDIRAECVVWTNLGVLLIQSSLNAEGGGLLRTRLGAVRR